MFHFGQTKSLINKIEQVEDNLTVQKKLLNNHWHRLNHKILTVFISPGALCASAGVGYLFGEFTKTRNELKNAKATLTATTNPKISKAQNMMRYAAVGYSVFNSLPVKALISWLRDLSHSRQGQSKRSQYNSSISS
jgi:hypothetical protein